MNTYRTSLGARELSALEREGAVTLGSALDQDTLQGVLSEIETLSLEPISYKIKGGVWGQVTGLDWDNSPLDLPPSLQALASMTEEALNAIFPEEVLDGPVKFNNFSLRKYPKQDADIAPPHRDYYRYQNLIALWVLKGPANFHVCRDLEKTGAQEVKTTGPGQLILMRGTGYAGIEERPYHFVGPTDTERISFGLRQIRQV